MGMPGACKQYEVQAHQHGLIGMIGLCICSRHCCQGKEHRSAMPSNARLSACQHCVPGFGLGLRVSGPYCWAICKQCMRTPRCAQLISLSALQYCTPSKCTSMRDHTMQPLCHMYLQHGKTWQMTARPPSSSAHSMRLFASHKFTAMCLLMCAICHF